MNDIKDLKYFSLDLELNNKNDGTTPKIIQVGVAVGSPVRPDDIQTFSWYINPEEPITEFISKLTGITDEIIKEKAVSHERVAEELGALININKCFVNPVLWGGNNHINDATELQAEFRERNIKFPFFGHRIFDVKTLCVFQQMVQGKSSGGGLRRCMNSYGLLFEGEPHRAEIDAKNTLRFFFYLLNTERKRQETVQQLKEL